MRFFVTIGVQFGHGRNQTHHPVFNDMTCDDWIEVEAPSELAGRYRVMAAMDGSSWCGFYTEHEWPEIRDRYHPGRCVEVLS